ncbi:hypothetical protein VDBG_02171 [Verticillium alfalfae VaMs.102]|uniref:Uncharacterized protein n=1 Tax=Verticillium alfalfae (strain VaMs.102 / ATCC MYA-4576 / FGSC 10136) TaxID=526221 RepID=C9S9J9_VERA1|nr:hypothetical protein VDBG_02171 [Verticillium alfalfae VaMs.102]EEY16062.1 hypothetical protein VDBG_02171 [Verticillium alfalfae VaMs.102]
MARLPVCVGGLLNSSVYGAGWLECDCAKAAGSNVRNQTALNACVLANATSTNTMFWPADDVISATWSTSVWRWC